MGIHSVVSTWVLGLLIAGSASAQMYPERQAARMGYKEFEKISEIVEPLVNQALSKKDWHALALAAPDIQNAIIPLSAIKYKSRNNFKLTAFKNGLANLTQTVADFAGAARNSDSTAVFQLFPHVHEQIDQVATALLPLEWREFETLKATAATLQANKIKDEDDKTPLLSKVDDIQGQINLFSASAIPASIQYRAQLIHDEQAYFGKLATKMKESLDHHDMDKFRTQVTELNVRLGTFQRLYLE